MLFKKKAKKEEGAPTRTDMRSGELAEVEAHLADMKAQQELSMDALGGVAGGMGEAAQGDDSKIKF